MEEAIYGCPGTGKTHTLNERAAFYRSTVAPEDFQMIGTSFGQTAVQNLQHRIGAHFPELRETVATLHAFGYRQLERPTLVEQDKDAIAEWNKRHPEWPLSLQDSENDDYGGGQLGARGDEALNHFNLLRHKLIPEAEWATHPKHIQYADFWRKWSAFKEYHYGIDFTDMIELPYRRNLETPFNAKVALVDEAQDLTPLMLARVRQWEAHGTRLVQAGDDDQSINGFNGADAAVWTDHDGIRAQIVLPQSYRMPVAVHDYSQRIISRVKHRVAKTFQPMATPGEIIDWQMPMSDRASMLKAITDGLDYGSVMVLASCNYMLSQVPHWLQEEGLTYWNKNRPRNRNWNPLHFTNGVPTPLKLVSVFYKQPWSWEQAGFLADMLANPRGKGLFTNASKIKEISRTRKSQPFDGHALLNTDALEAMRSNPVEFFKANAKADKVKQVMYGLNLADKGPEYAYEQPAITIGTIFSVKGDEADTVIIAPDLSPNGWLEYNGKGRDSTHRLFYVGITRAKSRVILLSARGRQWRYHW